MSYDGRPQGSTTPNLPTLAPTIHDSCTLRVLLLFHCTPVFLNIPLKKRTKYVQCVYNRGEGGKVGGGGPLWWTLAVARRTSNVEEFANSFTRSVRRYHIWGY